MCRVTYLTKLTPHGDDFIFYLGRKVMRQGATSFSVSSILALAHHRQIDVLVMRTGDRERSVNAKAKRAPCHIMCPVHDPGDVNHEQACLLLQGQLELIVDQLDDDAQVVVFVALLLEGVLHLAELLL